MRAMVKIDAARAQEVDSKLVAASRLVTRLQTQLRMLAQELRDAEAERDHLSQVAESGEEESDIPVRYQVIGTDLCAVRDDPIDWRPDRRADPVLARRPATPEDRTVPLPFDRFTDLAERAGVPPVSILASANPDLPSPEKPYAVGDLLFADPRGGVMTADGTHVGHVTETRADGVMVVEHDDTPTESETPDLPSPEAPKAVDALTAILHRELGDRAAACIELAREACAGEEPTTSQIVACVDGITINQAEILAETLAELVALERSARSPSLPSPEPDPLATWTKNALRDHETRMPAGYNRGRLVATNPGSYRSDSLDEPLLMRLPPLPTVGDATNSSSPEKPYAVGDRLTHPVHGEAEVCCIGEGPEPRFCLLPDGASVSDYIWVSTPGLAWWRTVPEPGFFEQAASAPDAACMAESPLGYVCTLPAGHGGEHMAEGVRDEAIDRWPGEDEEAGRRGAVLSVGADGSAMVEFPGEEPARGDQGSAEASGGACDPVAELANQIHLAEPTPTEGPEHEPSLAVKKNRPADDDFSDDPAAAEAARDAVADIARDRKSRPRAEEAEPDASAGCVRVKRPRRSREPQEGGKASPDTAADVRQLLVERLGARGAKRAESEARKACEGVKPDEELIRCADIGGVDEELRKLLVRLLELEPAAAKSGAPKARKGGRR